MYGVIKVSHYRMTKNTPDVSHLDTVPKNLFIYHDCFRSGGRQSPIISSVYGLNIERRMLDKFLYEVYNSDMPR